MDQFEENILGGIEIFFKVQFLLFEKQSIREREIPYPLVHSPDGRQQVRAGPS